MSINTKATNSWINHVKKYQSENNCTYSVALKEAKATYEKPEKKVSKIIEETPVEEASKIIEETPIKKKRIYKRKNKVPDVVDNQIE